MRFIALVNHFLSNQSVVVVAAITAAIIGAITGLTGLIIWKFSISVSNTRWRKAIQKGAYADSIQKEHIALQNARIVMLQNREISLKRQNIRYRKAIQAMTSTAQRATIVLLEEEKADE